MLLVSLFTAKSEVFEALVQVKPECIEKDGISSVAIDNNAENDGVRKLTNVFTNIQESYIYIHVQVFRFHNPYALQ